MVNPYLHGGPIVNPYLNRGPTVNPYLHRGAYGEPIFTQGARFIARTFVYARTYTVRVE